MLTRRSFLGRLAGALAAVVAAPVLLKSAAPFVPEGFVPVADGYVPGPQTFNVGDVITIEGRYAVHPVTYERMGHLQRFVVTEVCSAGEIVALPAAFIWPAMVYHGPYQNISGTAPIEASDVRPVRQHEYQPIAIDWSKHASFTWEGLGS